MFDWCEYLKLAETLSRDGGEGSVRSAISRAYYSAFCSARNWLDKNEDTFTIPPPGESHKQVWDTLDRGPQRQKKQIAALGRRLRATRNSADYDNEFRGKLDDKCREAIEQARKVVTLLNDL